MPLPGGREPHLPTVACDGSLFSLHSRLLSGTATLEEKPVTTHGTGKPPGGGGPPAVVQDKGQHLGREEVQWKQISLAT